jgi:hypothetical protein
VPRFIRSAADRVGAVAREVGCVRGDGVHGRLVRVLIEGDCARIRAELEEDRRISRCSLVQSQRSGNGAERQITLAQHDSRVTTIMVRDHGIGIGAEQIPVFFTRFGR